MLTRVPACYCYGAFRHTQPLFSVSLLVDVYDPIHFARMCLFVWQFACLAAGYSDLTGGYEGGQAEYARVPFGESHFTLE